ncbi:hypothetical protein [Fluviicola taffensis]|uniref:hypothetical protein n=1 Tax=Fluviicola taffensis TaxID=191579 RepID=UPI0005B65298|nr:hypothetical protein [Fluviicola taffensis]
MYKSLRLISIICFLSLTSNLVGNFVWACIQQKESINLSLEEDDSEERDSDSEENNGSSKRGVNLLEEELHLADCANLSTFDIDFKLVSRTTFSIITDKTNGSKKAPLDNPPEIVPEFS